MAIVEATVEYDEATMSLTVSVTGISSAASLRIEIPGGLRIADNPVESDAMDLLLHAQMLYRTKELALQAVHKLGIGAIGALRTMNRGPRYANDFWITDMPARPGTGVIDWLALSSDWRYQLAGVIDEPVLSISQRYRPALKHAVPTARVSPAHPNPRAHAAHAPDSTQARNAAPSNVASP